MSHPTALPPRYAEVLLGLVDSLQPWLDKARATLEGKTA